MNPRTIKRGSWLVLSCLMLAALAGYWIEIPHSAWHSLDGRFEVILTKRLYHSLLPGMPGDSSGGPGFLELKTRDGLSLGKVPLPSLSLATDMRWSADSARIPALVQWDFKAGELRYWNEAQTQQKLEFFGPIAAQPANMDDN